MAVADLEGRPAAGDPSFEEELENLERVVELLERGELGLEEAIRQYESGHLSLQRCRVILESCRKRIEILGAQGAGPAAEFTPFDRSEVPPGEETPADGAGTPP